MLIDVTKKGYTTMLLPKKIAAVSLAVLLAGCGDDNNDIPVTAPPSPPAAPTPSEILTSTIEQAANGSGIASFTFPASDDLANIPQDPNNPLTAEKVVLGQMLYHETAISTEGVNGDLNGTWSCASCHHAAAGFKAGIPQGIGEGGSDFGATGAARVLATGFDKSSPDPTLVPDVQPVTSPAVLNVAYQEVMLWNGQFGAQVDGIVNAGLATDVLATPGTPKAENARNFGGVEIQAVAGQAVHRLRLKEDSVLQTNQTYIDMYDAAFPNGYDDQVEGAALAIAAFERTILANEAPFQRWLNGEADALGADEIAGATLFFGKAGCADCHRGPGLSSEVGATEDEIFFAQGFADFDINNPQITGGVGDADSRGRGGFTREVEDNYKFKIAQLYNLKDTNVFGHGASFENVRDVVAYKNAGVSQKILPAGVLDPRFQPLGLTETEIDQLTMFLEESLYDPNLSRYVPTSLPTGACLVVGDDASRDDVGC